MSLSRLSPPSKLLRDAELSRHDGESDRTLRFEHPNLERAGAQPHPAARREAAARAAGRPRTSSSAERPR